MLMSALHVYATWRTANCVVLAILIGSYQLVNDIYVPTEVMQRYTAELQDRVPLQVQSAIYSFGWIAQLQQTVSAGTGSSRPTWRWRLLCLSSLCWNLNDYSRCVVIWQEENGTETKEGVSVKAGTVGLFLKLNRHILAALNAVYCELKCNPFLSL